jgi:hypothetical protein
MTGRAPHEDCGVTDPCEEGDPGTDGGGRRHFLDGEAIHCGTCLELQAIDFRSDDYGLYTVPLQNGAIVTYEAAWHGAADGPRATLHASVGGHEFMRTLEPWMRFRWSRR